MRRDATFLSLALGVHGAVLLWAELSSRRPPRAPAASAPAQSEMEIDLRPNEEPKLAPPQAPEMPLPAAPSRAPLARAALAHASPHAALPEWMPVLDEPSPSPAADSDTAFAVGTTSVDVLANRASAAVLATVDHGADMDRGAERNVRTGMRDRDFSLGLGASGPVVTALEEVARTSVAEVESQATLEVVSNADGVVVSANVVEAGTARPGWEAVARALVAKMAGKRLRVPKGAHGLAITIAVDSREALPSGAAPGVNVSLFDQKLAHGKNERSASVSILPLAKLAVVVPTRQGFETKMVTLPVPLPQIGAVFDATDFGAKALRAVHAHATREREF